MTPCSYVTKDPQIPVAFLIDAETDQVPEEHNVSEDDRIEEPERDSGGVGIVSRHGGGGHPSTTTR